jgi:hypothetical protein
MDAVSRRADPVATAQPEVLPAPVRCYLAAAIPESRRVQRVTLTQSGLFSTSEQTGRWKPFTAEQQVTTEPPGFVWKATIRIGPFLPVKVVDAYQDGSGFLHARLLGVVPVAKASGPETDEGELMRYLAEAIWYPTALLPSDRLSWHPLDEHSARAVLRDRAREVSARFCFDSAGMVFRIEADRFRAEHGHYRKRPWRAYCGQYATRGGFRIPLEARVAWRLPEGECEYFRGRIQSIEYDP